ncbi:TIGR00341 family protein [Rivularia sp. UHCC 0363]|uniref:TIGR00341 family protein n=1 Tax=Rivularia sp. UHCC 0363 TaxID=3110244 RepID=UPI002B1F2982|nr:TIGR00341 family protein [Rivularia sp. UHCC 0363]MEA5592816.1 TIGR00341 family protein [Rivularia sp. UHCC 0363]
MHKKINHLLSVLVSNKVHPFVLKELQDNLQLESTINSNYLILIFASCAIAAFGLLSNSAAVIIGAMIIAPLMLPIRGLAFGALEGDLKLFRIAFHAVAVGSAIAIFLAWIIGLLSGISSYGSEIYARSQPNLLDLAIAIVAGGISGYAKVQPKIESSLAGTAISVALMPPLCVIGLGLAQGDWDLSLGATLLYLTNLLGITLSCMVSFSIKGYTPAHQARKALGLVFALTGLLVIPLSLSFLSLVQQTRLEANIKKAFLSKTLTFREVKLEKTETNWLTNPPEIRLTVRSKEALTSKQVGLLEDFINQQMKGKYSLVVEIPQVEEVKR